MTVEDEAPPRVAGGLLQLSDAHRSELAASNVSDDAVEARGYRTLYGTDADRRYLKEQRIPKWAYRDESAWPLLLLPMYRPGGESAGCQVKPAVPQRRDAADAKTAMKYASPAGTLHLDVPPSVADRVTDAAQVLWVTEGIKKADCLASQGRAVVTLSGVFNWRAKNGTLGDWEDIPLRGRSVVVCFDSDARHNRNVLLAMRRLGAWLEAKGARPQYLIVPERVGEAKVKGIDDYYAAGGDWQDLVAALTREAPGDGTADAFFTDAMLTDTLCSEEMDGVYRYAPGLGWMRWSGRVWQESPVEEVIETARMWATKHFNDVLDQQKLDPNRNLRDQLEGWRGAMSASKLRNLVSLAKGVLLTDTDAFDADPDLLNCPNGVVDLRTGALLPSDPDLLLTKITGCDYVKDARHPDWDKALTALPEDVREWFQIRMGQAATGHTPTDDLALFLQGGGSNGKSSIMDGVSMALHRYQTAVADRAMLGNASDNHPTEMMDFLGARLAVLEETPEARQLDTVRLKKLTGTKEITARKIRQDSVTFQATHALVVNTNYRPVVSETDHGTWRRLALVRFPYTFRRSAQECRGEMDRVGDPTLRDRLRTDRAAHEAALAWTVAGARRWYEANRIFPPLPERVRKDTQAWREESDPMLGFINEALAFERGANVAATELWDAFSTWMDEKRNKPWSQKTFVSRFAGHDACSQNGVIQKRIRPNGGLSTRGAGPVGDRLFTAWMGLRFRGPQDDPDEVESAPERGVEPFGRVDEHDRVQTPSETSQVTELCAPCAVSPVNREIASYRAVNGGDCTRCTSSPNGTCDVHGVQSVQGSETVVPTPREAPLDVPRVAAPEPQAPVTESDSPALSDPAETMTEDPDDPFAGWPDVRGGDVR